MKTTLSSVIIIGSGIAGLYAALKLAENNKHVLIITKSTLGESNSRYAQGGIVGVLPENGYDSVELHVKDTLIAGAGLTDPTIAEFISKNSADAIKDLLRYGVPFDRDENNNISMTLEGAHSVNRILHAGGDATGKNIELTLSHYVEINPNIKIYQKTQAVDLLIDSSNNCRGVIALNVETGEYETIFSSAVIIASGGVGQVYSSTTNPQIATGDGIALAYRAGAVLQDMEFIQFHPTALTIQENNTRFLISESVRGEGAKLVNESGDTFTQKYDRRGDLAPRDVVTRAIFFEMAKNNSNCVYLDTSPIDKNKLVKRFPNILKACDANGIDILKANIPVSPAAHYIMGGIKIAIDGKTSIPGLFATGEASCNSLHGANRLASNSLLECTVVSRNVAESLIKQETEAVISHDCRINCLIEQYERKIISFNKNIPDSIQELKDCMWRNAGILRNEQNLTLALKSINESRLDFNQEYTCNSIEEYEYRNLLIVAGLIVKSALARKESRGAHFREDYPQEDIKAYHSYCSKSQQTLINSSLLETV